MRCPRETSKTTLLSQSPFPKWRLFEGCLPSILLTKVGMTMNLQIGRPIRRIISYTKLTQISICLPSMERMVPHIPAWLMGAGGPWLGLKPRQRTMPQGYRRDRRTLYLFVTIIIYLHPVEVRYSRAVSRSYAVSGKVCRFI